MSLVVLLILFGTVLCSPVTFTVSYQPGTSKLVLMHSFQTRMHEVSPCIMCVQYRGDAQYRGGFHEYRGGIS